MKFTYIDLPLKNREIVVAATFVQIESMGSPKVAARAHDADDLEAQLCTFIDPLRVLARPIDRIAFASDASLYRLIPRAVV
ncbi:MAG: hypothetical protein WB439_10225, partial [Acidobacteriaceae bacterium]